MRDFVFSIHPFTPGRYCLRVQALYCKVSAMNEHARAEEHLRIIRGLMERVTIYRAISAPAALAGGLLSTGTAILLHATGNGSANAGWFLPAWLFVLVATFAANAFLIYRGAASRGEPFISAGMRLAIQAVLPSILSAAIISIVLLRAEVSALLPIIWMLFYGLALLATGSFAPRSIVFLGSCFLAAALLLLSGTSLGWLPASGADAASLSMGLTFGLFHLVYAACTWPRTAQ
jgi:hypothetical protein